MQIAPVQPQLVESADGEIIWIPTDAELENIKKMVTLKYTISKIAIGIGVPEDALKPHLANPKSKVYIAYHEAKVQSELAYRKKVHDLAEAGEPWAITLLEKWDRDQRKEELGL